MSIIKRETKETRVQVELHGGTASDIGTGVQFLDHMLATLARYAGVGINIAATGDMKHHIIEDVAITLGSAIAQAVPPGAARYGTRTIPMDDALVAVAIDIGGRAFYRGPLPSSLYDHFMRTFAENARITLHIRVIRGSDRHHIVEAAFKALGLALRDALAESHDGNVFSTKGSVASESA